MLPLGAGVPAQLMSDEPVVLLDELRQGPQAQSLGQTGNARKSRLRTRRLRTPTAARPLRPEPERKG